MSRMNIHINRALLILYRITPVLLFNFSLRACRHILWNEKYWLPINKNHRLAITAKISALLILKNKNRFRSRIKDRGFVILLGGPARIGKSQIAWYISEQTGSHTICLDDFKFIFRKLNLEVLGNVKFEMLKIFVLFGNHLVIEGDELITDEADVIWMKFKKYPISKKFLKKVSFNLSPHLYLLGSSEISVAQKTNEIKQWASKNDCWLSDAISEENVDLISALLIKISSDLKLISNRSDMTYVETANRQILEIAEFIVAKTRHQTQFN